jgi:hypothetical protein
VRMAPTAEHAPGSPEWGCSVTITTTAVEDSTACAVQSDPHVPPASSGAPSKETVSSSPLALPVADRMEMPCGGELGQLRQAR